MWVMNMKKIKTAYLFVRVEKCWQKKNGYRRPWKLPWLKEKPGRPLPKSLTQDFNMFEATKVHTEFLETLCQYMKTTKKTSVESEVILCLERVPTRLRYHLGYKTFIFFGIFEKVFKEAKSVKSGSLIHKLLLEILIKFLTFLSDY